MVGRFSACGLSFRLTASAPTRRVGRGYDESAEATRRRKAEATKSVKDPASPPPPRFAVVWSGAMASPPKPWRRRKMEATRYTWPRFRKHERGCGDRSFHKDRQVHALHFRQCQLQTTTRRGSALLTIRKRAWNCHACHRRILARSRSPRRQAGSPLLAPSIMAAFLPAPSSADVIASSVGWDAGAWEKCIGRTISSSDSRSH